MRPADGNETAGAYIAALEYKGPTVLCLSRQNLPHLENSCPDKTLLGAYVVKDTPNHNLIFLASGSEVHIALGAAKILEEKHGLKVRLVSIPSTSLFEKQSVSYRRSVLTPGVPVVSVEASSTFGWERYAHLPIGMTTFGASAPLNQVLDNFGFTPAKVANRALQYLKLCKEQTKNTLSSSFHLLSIHADLQTHPKSHL